MFAAIGRGIQRFFQGWYRFITTRKSNIATLGAALGSLVVVCCVCAFALVFVQAAGQAVGVLPALLPTETTVPSPVIMPIPTDIPPADTPESTATPESAPTLGPTNTPEPTPMATEPPPPTAVSIPIDTPTPAGYISHSMLGDDWPFTVEDGVLECRGAGRNEVVFISGGVVYAINGIAKGTGQYQDVEPIWLDDPSIPGLKKNLTPILNRGLQLCR